MPVGAVIETPYDCWESFPVVKSREPALTCEMGLESNEMRPASDQEGGVKYLRVFRDINGMDRGEERTNDGTVHAETRTGRATNDSGIIHDACAFGLPFRIDIA